MCRITIATMTDFTKYQKSMIVDRLMSLAAGDDWQKDGWGISDGQRLFKNSVGYNDPTRTFKWAHTLEPEHPWVGHVRAASLKTGLSKTEAHPYAFGRFFGVHNGTMVPGTKTFPNTPESAPDTDSWRAMWLLHEIMRPYGIPRNDSREQWFLQNNILGQWLSHFMKTSTFVFAIMFRNDEILVVKGAGERTLWHTEAGNGYLLHTRPEHLVAAAEWGEHFNLNLGFEAEIFYEVPNDTWFVLKPGVREIKYHPLEYQLEVPPPATKKRKK